MEKSRYENHMYNRRPNRNWVLFLFWAYIKEIGIFITLHTDRQRMARWIWCYCVIKCKQSTFFLVQFRYFTHISDSVIIYSMNSIQWLHILPLSHQSDKTRDQRMRFCFHTWHTHGLKWFEIETWYSLKCHKFGICILRIAESTILIANYSNLVWTSAQFCSKVT